MHPVVRVHRDVRDVDGFVLGNRTRSTAKEIVRVASTTIPVAVKITKLRAGATGNRHVDNLSACPGAPSTIGVKRDVRATRDVDGKRIGPLKNIVAGIDVSPPNNGTSPTCITGREPSHVIEVAEVKWLVNGTRQAAIVHRGGVGTRLPRKPRLDGKGPELSSG
jgi:hypothetical protein